jgi:hypothetical protein
VEVCGVLTFKVRHWRLPVEPVVGDFVNWGYGPALVAVPDSTRVLLSLPGGSRNPWCTVDLATGQIVRGTKMPGNLRAAFFPPSESSDPRPWVLCAYGLGRLQLDGRATVTDVVRKGIGSFQTALLDLGDGLLGVGHRRGKTLLLLSAADGTAVKRIRVPGPDLSYRLPDGRVRVLGMHHAQVTDIDLNSRTVVGRHSIPYGAGARRIDNALIALIGQRQDIRVVDDSADARPGGTLVLRLRQPEHWPDRAAAPRPEPDLGWDIEREEVAIIDAVDLTIRRTAPVPPSAVEVLGVDHDGRIAVATQDGLTLLDPDTLKAVASHQTPHGILGAVLCPTRNAAALLGGHDPAALTVLNW